MIKPLRMKLNQEKTQESQGDENASACEGRGDEWNDDGQYQGGVDEEDGPGEEEPDLAFDQGLYKPF